MRILQKYRNSIFLQNCNFKNKKKQCDLFFLKKEREI